MINVLVSTKWGSLINFTDMIDVDLPEPREFATREMPAYYEKLTEVREALRRTDVA